MQWSAGSIYFPSVIKCHKYQDNFDSVMNMNMHIYSGCKKCLTYLTYTLFLGPDGKEDSSETKSEKQKLISSLYDNNRQGGFGFHRLKPKSIK